MLLILTLSWHKFYLCIVCWHWHCDTNISRQLAWKSLLYYIIGFIKPVSSSPPAHWSGVRPSEISKYYWRGGWVAGGSLTALDNWKLAPVTPECILTELCRFPFIITGKGIMVARNIVSWYLNWDGEIVSVPFWWYWQVIISSKIYLKLSQDTFI